MATLWMESLPHHVQGLGVPRAREVITDDLESGVMVWDGVPDRVRLPKGLESAGEERLVLDHRIDTCAKCFEPGRTHLVLDGPEAFNVCGCHTCGFVFYNYKT